MMTLFYIYAAGFFLLSGLVLVFKKQNILLSSILTIRPWYSFMSLLFWPISLAIFLFIFFKILFTSS